MVTNNSVNITASGIVKYDGTSAFSAVTTTQYNLLVGAASNGIASVAPSAASGVPVISQGVSANPTFGTCLVAGGGTGAATLTGVLTGNGTGAVTANAVTANGVLIGGASNAVSSLGVATDGQVLMGATAAAPAFGTITANGGATITVAANSVAVNTGSFIQPTIFDWVEDFQGWTIGTCTSTAAGTAAAVAFTNLAASSYPGVWSLSTGSTNAGAVTIRKGNLILGYGITTCTWIFNLATLSDGTDRYTIRLGLGDTTTGAKYTSGVWVEYCDNVNSGNWTYNCGNGTTDAQNSAVAVATGWQVVQMVVNAAATSVSFSAGTTVAGLSSLGAAITTHIPTAQLGPSAMIVKSNGTTARILLVDYVGVNIPFTTAR